jgi:hypothetical protein
VWPGLPLDNRRAAAKLLVTTSRTNGRDAINLRQLRYFVRVIEVGNITRAAEQLNVAQPLGCRSGNWSRNSASISW